MKTLRIAGLLLATGALLLLGACGDRADSSAADREAVAGFAPHAFPPTLTDMDYHQRPWGSPNCLLCHENGLDGAPIVQHRGMPGYLKQAECRTCHVLIAGSKPGE